MNESRFEISSCHIALGASGEPRDIGEVHDLIILVEEVDNNMRINAPKYSHVGTRRYVSVLVWHQALSSCALKVVSLQSISQQGYIFNVYTSAEQTLFTCLLVSLVLIARARRFPNYLDSRMK